ncbi:TlpA family protein disulfide reductase [Algoriphagus sp. NG3]|uniref:TlpA family protein disulfide reductase n=1 Tax=Algoriphagus sp. NG3 TaxID=3097546 RepID=UPI002A7F164A|nr:thioredoxin-like domain-containing protein [Algoriphagus sp. NG3]WPR76272.1 thioredoxin-like domain-containing protein [Algoriphagus sp. NG3]
MKKTILICLVGLLCLPTSTLLAQVADSPGADFLHRSSPTVSPEQGDTHRGGVTRSDTLPENNGLVDHSAAKGQESESSSAEVVIYGEIRGDVDSDQVEAKIYSNLLDVSSNIPSATVHSLPLELGHLYSGNIGLKTFQFTLPMEGELGYLDIRIGKSHPLDMFLVAAGDSVRIHLDLQNGRTIFTGPDADAFRLQAEIHQKLQEDRLSDNPVMFTPDRNRFLSDPEDLQLYKEISSTYQSGWSRKLDFLDSEELIYQHAKKQMGSAPDLEEYLQVLANHKDKLDKKRYAILKADIIGRTQMQPLDFFFRNLAQDHRYQDVFDSYRSAMESLWDGDEVPAVKSYFFGEYLYLRTNIQVNLDATSLVTASEELPQQQKELVLAKAIVKNFRRIPDLHKSVEAVLQQVQAPWIANELNQLIARQAEGSTLPHIGFEDREGKETFPQEWQGKVVLLDLWLVGCKACAGFYQERLLPLYEEFGDREDFLIATVAVDKDRDNWIKGLESGNYTDPGFTNLYAAGYNHPFLDHYKISAFPSYMLIGKDGRILKSGDFPKDLSGWMDIMESYLSSDQTHSGI